MTENDGVSTEQPEGEEQPGGRVVMPGGDYLLAALISTVNGYPGDIGYPLTLSLHGTLVSGETISGRTYFDMIASALEQAWPRNEDGTSNEGVFDRFREFGDAMYPRPNESGEETNAGRSQPVAYVHLKNVTISQPGAPMIEMDATVAWRCKIDAIDAWTLGTMATTTTSSPGTW